MSRLSCEMKLTEYVFRLQALQWRRWFVRCKQCFCMCDTQNHSHRYFSLHDVVSDINQNKYDLDFLQS